MFDWFKKKKPEHESPKYIEYNSRSIAEWQITQLYDTDWPADLLQAGHWRLSQNLERFIDGGECSDSEIFELRDIMVSSMMQKD